MTYHAKTNWKFDDPVTEDDFNRIEQGIKGAYEGLEEKGNEIAEHEAKKNNPHDVNKEQIGLSNVDNVKQATKEEFGSHVVDDSNPHKVTKSQVGLGNVQNYGLATQSEAESGTSNTKYMTPQRTKQAIEKLTPEGMSEQDVDDKITTHTEETDVHGLSNNTVIIGEYAQASSTDSVAIGRRADAAGRYATAVGSYAKTSSGSTAFGSTSSAGSSSVAVGSDSSAGSSSIAVGHSVNAGNHATVVGYQASAPTDSIAIGSNSSAGSSATAVGRGSSAGSSSIAVGGDSSAGNTAIVVGRYAIAEGNYSAALGYYASARNDHEGVLGREVNSWNVPGAFTVSGTKNFEIPHPHPDKKDTHRLRHSAVESPTAGDNLYRFTIEAEQNNETVKMQLPDYFKYLNKDVDVWVNGHLHFGRAFGVVEGDKLKVTCETAGKYKVLVIGTRNDEHQSLQDWDIKGVEREIGESWTGETYVFEVDEILEIEEIKEEDVA